MNDYILIEKALRDEYAQITTDLKTIALRNEKTGDWEALPVDEMEEADLNSEADGVEDWNERNATVTQLETTYRNIVRALKKIEHNTFGICEICEEPIAPQRLAILPTARTCAVHIDDERTLPL